MRNVAINGIRLELDRRNRSKRMRRLRFFGVVAWVVAVVAFGLLIRDVVQ